MKYLKTFESKIKTENYLKEYAQYLLDIYKEINPEYDNSRTGIWLIEFIEKGTMENRIRKNTTLKVKISVLNDEVKYRIKRFMNDINLNIDNIFEYDEFVSFKKSGLTLDEYVSSKKYNI